MNFSIRKSIKITGLLFFAATLVPYLGICASVSVSPFVPQCDNKIQIPNPIETPTNSLTCATAGPCGFYQLKCSPTYTGGGTTNGIIDFDPLNKTCKTTVICPTTAIPTVIHSCNQTCTGNLACPPIESVTMLVDFTPVPHDGWTQSNCNAGVGSLSLTAAMIKTDCAVALAPQAPMIPSVACQKQQPKNAL